MTARIVTPAEAREMLGDETEWRWEDSLCPGDSIVAAVYDDESEDNIALICGPLPSHDFAERRARLIVSAPDLAATIASEPERVEAAVDAERDAIVANLREWARQSAHRTGNYADALNAAADEIAAGRAP